MPEENILSTSRISERRTSVVPIRRMAWSAIFAGVVITMASQILLSLLGLGIGLATIGPHTGSGLATGTAIWWSVTMLVSLFIGGWMSGRLGGIPRRSDGILHGVVTWGLVTVISLALVTTAIGSLVGGALSLVGHGLGAGAQAVASMAPQSINLSREDGEKVWNEIREEGMAFLRQTKNPALQPENLEARAEGIVNSQGSMTPAEFETVVDRFVRAGKNVASEVDKASIVNVLMARTDMSRSEAQRTVEGWQNRYEKGRAEFAALGDRAGQAAERAGNVSGAAAIVAFIGILLGAVSAGGGGAFGALRQPPPLTAQQSRMAA